MILTVGYVPHWATKSAGQPRYRMEQKTAVVSPEVVTAEEQAGELSHAPADTTETTPVQNGPTMQVNVSPKSENENLVPDEKVVGLMDEVLDGLRDERKEASKYIEDLYDMIINGGDATSATKEAFVNLVRAKRETTSEMARVLDLMIRLKMKDKSLPPVVTQQINEFHTRPKKSSVMEKLRRKGNKQ